VSILRTWKVPQLLKVGIDDFDQFLGRLYLVRRRPRIRTKDVEPNVVLNDFRHKPVDRASAGGDRLQCRKALLFLFQCFFYGVDLSSYTPDAI